MRHTEEKELFTKCNMQHLIMVKRCLMDNNTYLQLLFNNVTISEYFVVNCGKTEKEPHFAYFMAFVKHLFTECCLYDRPCSKC